MPLISIQDKIKQIQDDAEAKILALKQEAASGIAKKLSEAKDRLKAAELEVKQLQDEYALATGKTVKGEKVGGTRRRLKPEEKAALAEAVKATLKSFKDGAKLSDLVSASGESPSAVRESLKSLGKNVSKTGNKASTRYFAK